MEERNTNPVSFDPESNSFYNQYGTKDIQSGNHFDSAMIHFYLHSYGQHDEKNKIGPCIWPHFDLLFVHEGEISMQLMKRDHVVLSGGQGILIYPLTHFQGYSVTPVTKTSVQHFGVDPDDKFLPVIFQKLAGKQRDYELFKADHTPLLTSHIASAIQWASLDPEPVLHDMRVAILTLILGELQSNVFEKHSNTHYSLAMDQLIRWMRDNLTNPNLTLKEMADRIGLSTSHFRAVFKSYSGSSPGRFLFNMRMLEAKRYLRETILPIKEISERLGYSNLTHFYRAFKVHDGRSPHEYRTLFITRG